MNELMSFIFRDMSVRITDQNGDPWFVAKDVCDVLGLGNAREALRNLDDDEVGSVRLTDGTSPLGGNPNMNIINESGLYNLIFRSNKPEAKAFRKWVTSVVLPSIRKTGSYSQLKKDHKALQNVYDQNEKFRDKYINLLDDLEREKPFWWKSLRRKYEMDIGKDFSQNSEKSTKKDPSE
ncbi:hypothetical protein AGMMS50268_09120 [Spirochaetia bacterium]|nr:hypothetical protein AGMMS50268_09120 [Spirochaetia bacterium]